MIHKVIILIYSLGTLNTNRICLRIPSRVGTVCRIGMPELVTSLAPTGSIRYVLCGYLDVQECGARPLDSKCSISSISD